MSKLRLNSLQNPDSSAVNIELTSTGGAVVSGILTASSIDGGTITATNITSTDLIVEGTITYDDVTNVDSVGVITARNGIDVNAGGIDVTAGGIDVTAGGINAVGIVTATSFSGEDYLLSAIDTSVTDTAIDIFVYDTSKDSDGGAWRKRTQHTSWYNETLNTATRGSRKEFPAVAVIVAESNQVTIYDGDDPDLPMWMVFNQATNYIIYTTITSVYMLNGKLIVGTNPNAGDYYDGGIKVFDFISEFIRGYAWSYSPHNYNLNISQRNANNANSVAIYSSSNGILANTNVNDVAMTVIPSAPIDDATGLPVPTIAVATNSGVSVVTDDGTVVDIRGNHGGNYNKTTFVDFDSKTNAIISGFNYGTADGGVYKLAVFPIPSADITDDNTLHGYQHHYRRIQTGGNVTIPKLAGNHITDAISAGGDGRYAIQTTASGGNPTALNIIQEEPGTHSSSTTFPSNSRVAYATTSYNTGWMHGDIKGAFLSNTDATNLVEGDVLGGKGTFDDASYWTVGGSWTVSGGVATATSGTNSYLQKNGILTTGARYVIKVTVSSYSTGTLYVYCGTGAPGLQNHYFGISANGTYTMVLDAYNTNFGLYNSSFTGVVDNVTVSSVVDQDRSVNGKDLGVIGTVTRSAVATGAELVAYSGFTDNDYLRQPYDSSLDFGTGDYYMSIWAKGGGDAQCLMIREHGTADDDGAILLFQSSNKYHFFSRQNGTAQWTNFLATNAKYGDYWSHLMMVRSGGTLYGYVNGKLEGSISFAGDVSNNDAEIYIGRRNPTVDNSQEYSGSLALARIGKSAPSPEQIKKMYEDEKFLFQENAACTLYGSSDEVTAMAYDEVTETLHIGTSAGRSDFQGLRRINNTTTAVTTAISASGELIAEQ